MKKTLLLAGLLCLVAIPASADLLISEVFYDHTGGADTNYEWVEILNTGGLTLDITGYILAWGGTDYSWGTLELEGYVSACSAFVIGGPFGDNENGNPNYHMAVDLSPDVQNSGTMADGVALFLPGSDVLVDTPIDAVIYGGVNSNGLLDETGAVGGVEVGDANQGNSIERISTANTWVIQSTPDPNNEIYEYLCDGQVIPTERNTWDALKSIYR